MVAEWILWGGGIITTVVGTIIGAFIRDYLKTRKKSRKNQSMLIGNDNDATHDGLACIVSDNNQKLEAMEGEVNEVRDNVRDIKEVVIDSSEQNIGDFGFTTNGNDESEE